MNQILTILFLIVWVFPPSAQINVADDNVIVIPPGGAFACGNVIVYSSGYVNPYGTLFTPPKGEPIVLRKDGDAYYYGGKQVVKCSGVASVTAFRTDLVYVGGGLKEGKELRLLFIDDTPGNGVEFRGIGLEIIQVKRIGNFYVVEVKAGKPLSGEWYKITTTDGGYVTFPPKKPLLYTITATTLSVAFLAALIAFAFSLVLIYSRLR